MFKNLYAAGADNSLKKGLIKLIWTSLLVLEKNNLLPHNDQITFLRRYAPTLPGASGVTDDREALRA